MQIKLSFLGAAQNVTGSRHLVEVDGFKAVVDCGLYQERHFADRNWDRFPVPPKKIDAVLLTHAHLDHCGLLPKFVKEGFRGKIYCTAATAKIAQIILLDSAHLQEEDAEFKRKRHEREGRKGPHDDVPLYTVADAEAVTPLFTPVEYDTPVKVGKGVTATFRDAGHVFGSSVIALKIDRNGDSRTVLFSGDVGRGHKPIIGDPEEPGCADYVLVESTYGNRVHESTEGVRGKLADAINETVAAGGNVVIPSFALERSQELLYHLNALMIEDRIPSLVTFLDSPMAIRITEVFREYTQFYDTEMAKLVKEGVSPFDLPGLRMTQTSRESKTINHIKGTAIIIAGSGMCTGGRVKHHLVNNITRRECTILFVGYQAVGTLGRRIVDGAEEVRILGRTYPVEARIARIHGFSAHADKNELLHWLKGLCRDPRKVFVVHGEEQSAKQFGVFLHDSTGWDVSVPAYKDEVVLE